jgi:hypothetical protein
MKFAPGDLLRNVRTNEDGKVIEAYERNGVVMYMVSVSIDSAGWTLGGRVGYWPENESEFSRNESLGKGLCA